MTACRLLLPSTGVELLRRLVLPEPLRLPPGFRFAADDSDPQARAEALDRAAEELRALGVLLPGAPGDRAVHPSVVADLEVLAAPELAITVRAARHHDDADLDVTACLAVRGPLGASLLRTGPTAVRLSAFAADDLVDELAGVVPAPPDGDVGRGPAETVPLDALLPGSTAGGAAARLRATRVGTLHATVLAGSGPGRDGAVVGSVEWVLERQGWTGLEPRPSVGGRPQVRLVPVTPADLARWLAPLAGPALARVGP